MNRKSVDGKLYKKDDEVISFEYYIAMLLTVLRYARIWPIDSFTPCETILSTIGTVIFIIGDFLILFPEIIALWLTTNNLRLFANIIGVICMHAASLIKWCYCIKKNREIVKIVTKLKKCHVLCQRIDDCEEGYQIYKNEMRHARRLSNFFLCGWMFACIYGVLHWCCNPLLLGFLIPNQMDSTNDTFKRNLPFFGWYPISTNNLNNYICLYVIQIIGAISSAIGIVCYDAFYVIMLIIICAQFQYINAILKTDFHKTDTSQVTFALERKLKNCVDCHIEIIKFLKLLQTFSSPIMFVQCVETLFLICLISFEAAIVKIAIDLDSILKIWSLLEYIIFACIQLFFFCFFASQLQYLSTQIMYSVYSCGWENVIFENNYIDERKNGVKYYKLKQILLMIILRAKKPIILTGGPFYTLSLDTCKLIISMAISNCLILRTLYETDN